MSSGPRMSIGAFAGTKPVVGVGQAGDATRFIAKLVRSIPVTEVEHRPGREVAATCCGSVGRRVAGVVAELLHEGIENTPLAARKEVACRAIGGEADRGLLVLERPLVGRPA